MNNFQKDLIYSLKRNEDETINQTYFRIFPDLKEIVPEERLEYQLKGIDKRLIFENSREMLVDEKKRRKDYGDILLEEYSNFENKKIGWLGRDKQTDYIAYVIYDSKKMYLLPFKLLQLAWLKNYPDWLDKYGRKFANNGNYKTSNIPIPTNELLNKIQEQINQKIC